MTRPAQEARAPSTAVPHPRQFAGFAVRDLALVMAFVLLTLWASWATRELLALRQARIVSVSLATLVRDFVSSEARVASSPEATAAHTRAYLAAVNDAMRGLTDDGATVLVSEAVVGNSVPDLTPQVAAAVKAKMATTSGAAGAAGDNHAQ